MIDVCKFCGQAHEVEGALHPEDVCECPEAQDYQRRRRSAQEAKQNLILLFGEDQSEDLIRFLNQAVDAVAMGDAEMIQIRVSGNISARIARKGPVIAVQRRMQSSQTLEA